MAAQIQQFQQKAEYFVAQVRFFTSVLKIKVERRSFTSEEGEGIFIRKEKM